MLEYRGYYENVPPSLLPNDLATGLEKITQPEDASWIGLQLSAKGHGGIYYNVTDGTTRTFAEVEGWWEVGTPYDETALRSLWATGQPDEKELIEYSNPKIIRWKCGVWMNYYGHTCDYNFDRCLADRFHHCAQVFPSGSLSDCPKCNHNLASDWHADNPGKLSDNWCYFLQRGYICQREPKLNPAFYAVEGRCVPSDPSSALLRF